MGPEYFWWGGWWIFPMIMPIIMIIVVVTVLYLIFGRGGVRPFYHDCERYYGHGRDYGSALEILKNRYAKGEITKEEFEKMKKDVLS